MCIRDRLWMELSAAALLCCDAAAWFVQGTPGEASHLIMVATNFVVYAGLYLVLFLFNHYVGCYLREDGRLCAPKRSRTVDITCAVGIGLVFVSQFGPLFYYIDAQNIYHRSDAFPLSMALLLIGMGTETTMMAQFYQKLTMGRRIAMFGCVVLPLSVAACQVFQDDISLISTTKAALQKGDTSSGKSAFCANCSGIARRADTVTPRSAASCGAAYSCSYRGPSRARSRCSKYSVGIVHSSCGCIKRPCAATLGFVRAHRPRT